MSKKIHRFLVETIPDGDHVTLLDARVAHQAHRVLKLEKGEQIILFMNGGADTVFEITDINKKGMLLTKQKTVPVPAPTRRIIAAISIPKGDAFELIVQKLTEIGVSEIVPVISARTVKQSVRRDRLQTISDEALEQCGGTTRVTIHEPLSLAECALQYPIPALYFDTDTTETTAMTAAQFVIYIGPEGGWSEEDLEILNKHAKACTLGPRVLRSETAAIVATYSLLWHS